MARGLSISNVVSNGSHNVYFSGTGDANDGVLLLIIHDGNSLLGNLSTGCYHVQINKIDSTFVAVYLEDMDLS